MTHEEMQRKAKSLDTAGLIYTIKDCMEAEQAGRGFNPKCGEYLDMASYCGMELRRRQA